MSWNNWPAGFDRKPVFFQAENPNAKHEVRNNDKNMNTWSISQLVIAN